jgi:cell fate regulator YaaT (PSP1 superfamily)
MKTCRDLVREKKLPMKIVNVHLSFDGGKIAFAFIADSRVDFRDLVKSLSRNFQRSVRLHQIGSRDEAKGIGGFGICGCQLCCVKFLKDIPSITTEDARVQQMGHRGSERISGLCGRLKCCLGFETEQYRELLKSMPNIGKVVKVDGKKCVVTEINPLSQRVTIKFENENKKRVSVKDLK